MQLGVAFDVQSLNNSKKPNKPHWKLSFHYQESKQGLCNHYYLEFSVISNVCWSHHYQGWVSNFKLNENLYHKVDCDSWPSVRPVCHKPKCICTDIPLLGTMRRYVTKERLRYCEIVQQFQNFNNLINPIKFLFHIVVFSWFAASYCLLIPF